MGGEMPVVRRVEHLRGRGGKKGTGKPEGGAERGDAESEAADAQANELWQEVRQLIAVQHLVNTVLHEKSENEKEPPQRLPDRR